MDLEELQGLSREQLIALVSGSPQPAAQTDQQTGGKKTRKAKKQAEPVKYLTDSELDCLFRAVRASKNVRDIAIFEVGYHRGLRASEVGLLRVTDVHLERNSLFVRRVKNGNSGEHLVTEREVKALRAWLKKRAGDGALFPSKKGSAISRKRLDVLMKQYGAAANLPADKRHFHCLRHSCGTGLLDRDVDIREVQHHLGHKDIRNTMIYAQVTDKKRKRTAERLYREW